MELTEAEKNLIKAYRVMSVAYQNVVFIIFEGYLRHHKPLYDPELGKAFGVFDDETYELAKKIEREKHENTKNNFHPQRGSSESGINL